MMMVVMRTLLEVTIFNGIMVFLVVLLLLVVGVGWIGRGDEM